jgi:hypothetical protein
MVPSNGNIKQSNLTDKLGLEVHWTQDLKSGLSVVNVHQ